MKNLIFVFVILNSSMAFAEDLGFKLIATSQKSCDFREIYQASKDLCELSLIYEEDAQTVSLFLLRDRRSGGGDYNSFQQDYSQVVYIKSFQVSDLFPSIENIQSISAIFLDEDQILFKARSLENQLLSMNKLESF